MSRPIVCYNGTPDSGGSGSCNTPPCGIGPVGLAAGKYFVGGFPVILDGDVLTPAPGTTPEAIHAPLPGLQLVRALKYSLAVVVFAGLGIS